MNDSPLKDRMIIAINVELARLYIEWKLIDKGEPLNDETYILLQKLDPSFNLWGKYFRNVALIQFHRGDILNAKETYLRAIEITEIGLFPKNSLKKEYRHLFFAIMDNPPEA